MSKRVRSVLIWALVILAVAAIILFQYLMSRVAAYEEGTTGNTSGNLLNGGLFCEDDGKIYFANPYDQNTLYVMDTDLTNPEQISDDNVSYLNVAGKYIFYTKRNDKKTVDSDALMSFSTTGLYRIKKNGSQMARLYDDPTQVACLYGNTVYYQHYDQEEGLLLYAAAVDASEDTLLLEEACAPYVVCNNEIYYTGMETDHAIRKISIQGGDSEVVADGSFTSLTMEGDYLYFMDMNADYALKRMPVSGGTIETLVSERLATYNVAPGGDTLYCQIDNGTDNGLYEYDLSGGSLHLLQSGDYNYLNITRDYLFFQEYDQSKAYVLDLATNSCEELSFSD